jgi:ankyrin repeat protein
MLSLHCTPSGVDRARMLITCGAIVNFVSRDGRTPLHFAAASYTGMDMTRLLVESGADVTIKDHHAWIALDSALEVAAIRRNSGSLEIVDYLLQGQGAAGGGCFGDCCQT